MQAGNPDPESRTRLALFDRWAANYDQSVNDIANAGQYPFAGYDQVMDLIVHAAQPEPGQRVLDLGTGTGNLAQKFLDAGCCVTGTDYSASMLAEARVKLPTATLVEADLRERWPGLVAGPFDAIVSAYVLHEFELPTKIVILQQACDRLSPGGCVVVGDIAFSTRADHDAARARWHESWDDSEHYWVADECLAAAEAGGLCGRWIRVSACAGVFVFSRPTG